MYALSPNSNFQNLGPFASSGVREGSCHSVGPLRNAQFRELILKHDRFAGTYVEKLAFKHTLSVCCIQSNGLTKTNYFSIY